MTGDESNTSQIADAKGLNPADIRVVVIYEDDPDNGTVYEIALDDSSAQLYAEQWRETLPPADTVEVWGVGEAVARGLDVDPGSQSIHADS